MKAVCVLSGGLDSTVATAIVKRQGHEIYIFHANYGHKSEKKEIEAVKEIAERLGAKETKFVDLTFLKELGHSSLTDESLEVPVKEEVSLGAKETPQTWVPMRNTVLLSLAGAYAESLGAKKIFVGFNAEEGLGYPDNRPPFVEAFNLILERGTASFTEPKPKIEAPLINLDKVGIIKKGIEVNAPFELTWSCYFGREKHCGVCESCQHRKRGFKETGVKDPIEYEA